jgi:hypothetical protein
MKLCTIFAAVLGAVTLGVAKPINPAPAVEQRKCTISNAPVDEYRN